MVASLLLTLILADILALFLFLAAFKSLFLQDKFEAVDFQLILKLTTSVVYGLCNSLAIMFRFVFDFMSLSGKLIFTSTGLLGVRI